MVCYAIKDDKDFYFCGMNNWDRQLRKAQLYLSIRWAKEVMNDRRFIQRKMKLVKVEIKEIGAVDDEGT